MARLPIPGQDKGTWGELLNDFLNQSLNADGSLKSSAITASGVYAKPSSGIPGTDLDNATQSNLAKANTSVQIGGDLAGSPTTPTIGKIQGTAVNASAPSNGQVLSYSTSSSAWVPSTVSSTAITDATSGTKGIVQLAGDLTGTASSPTIANGAITNAKLDSATQATLTSVSTKAPTASPTFTGTVTLPSATPTNATDAATKSYVDSQVTGGATADATSSAKGKIQLAGDLAGTAAAPTLAATSNVNAIIASNTTVTSKLDASTAASTYAPLASPTFSGTVTVPAPSNTTDATTKTYVDTTVASAVTSGATPDATTSAKGKIQLAGDLAGTAGTPTVAKINGVTLPGSAPTSGQVLTASSGTATAWSTPASAPVTSVAGKTGVVTLVEADVANLTTDLSAKATDSAVVHLTGTETITGAKTFSSLPTLPSTAPTNATDAATKSYVDSSVSTGATPDATTSAKGKIQLAGDLAGTASAPTVPGLANKLDTTTAASTYAPKASPTFTGTVTVPTPTNTTDATTKAYVDGVVSSGAPDATTSAKGKIQLAGDLAGTAVSPTVAKINGVTLPASNPSAPGQVLTSNGATTTVWQSPPAGVQLDYTASDIAPLGTQATGSTGKAADAGHVHAMPRLDQVNAPTASVALNSQKITGLANGTAATDAAAFGQIPLPGTIAGTFAAGNDGRFTSLATTAGNAAVAFTITGVKTANYTASPADYIPADISSSSFTVTLPTAPADKTRIGVKVVTISATPGSTTLTVAAGGSDVFTVTGGSTSLTFTARLQGIVLQYQASTSIWLVQSTDTPLGVALGAAQLGTNGAIGGASGSALDTSVVTGATKTVTTTYTLLTTDHIIFANSTSAGFTVTLPTAVGYSGRFTITGISTGNNLVTVATTSSQTISGASTVTVGTQASGAPYSSIDVASDGANWRIV